VGLGLDSAGSRRRRKPIVDWDSGSPTSAGLTPTRSAISEPLPVAIDVIEAELAHPPELPLDVEQPSDGPFGRMFVFQDPDGYAVTIHDAG